MNMNRAVSLWPSCLQHHGGNRCLQFIWRLFQVRIQKAGHPLPEYSEGPDQLSASEDPKEVMASRAPHGAWLQLPRAAGGDRATGLCHLLPFYRLP